MHNYKKLANKFLAIADSAFYRASEGKPFRSNHDYR